MPGYDVLFVIPHQGREEMLRQTLDSVIKQADTCDLSFAIVVVSQNQVLDPATKRLADESSVPLELLQAERTLTISALRNLGVARYTSDWVAFIDADVVLGSHWLARLHQQLCEQDDLVLVSAIQRAGPQPSELERIRVVLSNTATDCFVQFLPGRNLLLSREWVEAVGGFPEHLVTCEDYYFTDQVGQYGNLLYTTASDYIHLGEDKDYRTLFKKEIWRAQSNLQSLAGRTIPIREWPSIIVPFAIAGCVILALIALLSGTFAGVFLAFFAMSLPILAYSVRLRNHAGKSLRLCSIITFYAVYFAGRTYGSCLGLLKTIKVG